ncbi:MAG: PPOX class F420-dependent oxidoreductase [Anaerolineaceae bacterium]|nr:PPOX class F420-dependent oxidoreductase [Anaerolineaceae bacterium]
MLEKIAKGQFMALQSYKKSGDGVITPVWVVELESKLYVWTDENSWKVKRIRNNGNIKICSSNARGIPKSEWVEAQALIRDEPELNERVHKAMVKKYGIQYYLITFMQKLSGPVGRHITVEIS